MSEEKKFTIHEAHKALSAGLFNLCWEIMDKKELTDKDKSTLINAAHGSYYHWSRVGEPINMQRAEWMCSRAYSFLNRPEPALYHAKKCLELTKEHDFKDFDLSYSYEAMARAYYLNGDDINFALYLNLAKESAEQIKKKGDRDLFLSDIKDLQEKKEARKTIKHVVFWKLKDENKEKNLTEMIKRLKELKNEVPEVLKLETGVDFNGSAAAWDIALYTEFSSKDDLAKYQQNEKHIEVKEFIKTIISEAAVVDF